MTFVIVCRLGRAAEQEWIGTNATDCRKFLATPLIGSNVTWDSVTYPVPVIMNYWILLTYFSLGRFCIWNTEYLVRILLTIGIHCGCWCVYRWRRFVLCHMMIRFSCWKAAALSCWFYAQFLPSTRINSSSLTRSTLRRLPPWRLPLLPQICRQKAVLYCCVTSTLVYILCLLHKWWVSNLL